MLRLNGGITLSGLRLVSSDTIATSSLRSGKRSFILLSSGPTLPGASPPAITWQVRQLPLARSKASCCPFNGAADAPVVSNASAPSKQAARMRVLFMPPSPIAVSGLFWFHLVERTRRARRQLLAFRRGFDSDARRVHTLLHAFR